MSKFVFTDRESAYPNRYLVTKENGATEFIVLERADEPVVVGTPLNAETFNALIEDMALATQVTDIKVVKNSDGITVTGTLKDGDEIKNLITLDANGYPKQIITDDLTGCTISWEGFDE
jgi:hypothetical protein